MVNKLLSFCREQKLLSGGDRVICAVSGGKDSMAMLWCLWQYRQALGITVSAAHFNHGLRGEESQRDEDFVRKFCRDYGIPCYVGHGSVQPGKQGLEASARQARYDFLLSCDSGAKVATAHTADDNAETLLLHLVRGTSLPGLGGIPPARGRIIRPMLSVTRREIEDYLAQQHLPHVEDSSNYTDAFLRNRIRHHVMPLLQQENPQFSAMLSACALRLREDEAALDEMAQKALEQAESDGALSCHILSGFPLALQGRVLRKWLIRSGLASPEAVHIQEVLHLLKAARPSAWVQLPGNIQVHRQYDRLCLIAASDPAEELPLPCPGSVRWSGFEISCHPAVLDGSFQNKPNHFAISSDAFPHGVFRIRSRQSGDSIRLSGGTKTLKKLMIDRKIPASLRNQIPVLCCGEQIIAAGDLGADVRFLRTGGSCIVFTIKALL